MHEISTKYRLYANHSLSLANLIFTKIDRIYKKRGNVDSSEILDVVKSVLREKAPDFEIIDNPEFFPNYTKSALTIEKWLIRNVGLLTTGNSKNAFKLRLTLLECDDICDLAQKTVYTELKNGNTVSLTDCINEAMRELYHHYYLPKDIRVPASVSTKNEIVRWILRNNEHI